MKRVQVNALIDIFSLVTFIPSLISGLVIYFILPSGPGREQGPDRGFSSASYATSGSPCMTCGASSSQPSCSFTSHYTGDSTGIS
ncbi:MAG: hypothetical protein LUQ25_02750 [Methanoregulaceae archaeon]|nr:hypothetical protein [Methanoregulaceae archaeon]